MVTRFIGGKQSAVQSTTSDRKRTDGLKPILETTAAAAAAGLEPAHWHSTA